VKIEKLVRALPRRVCHVCLRRLTIMPAMLDATAPSWPEPFGLVARARSERVHLVAGWCDIGNSIRQLRLRHRQRIEGFAQQLDLTSLCHQVPSEQLMERSPRPRGIRRNTMFPPALKGWNHPAPPVPRPRACPPPHPSRSRRAPTAPLNLSCLKPYTSGVSSALDARAWRNGRRSGLEGNLSARRETGDAELPK